MSPLPPQPVDSRRITNETQSERQRDVRLSLIRLGFRRSSLVPTSGFRTSAWRPEMRDALYSLVPRINVRQTLPQDHSLQPLVTIEDSADINVVAADSASIRAFPFLPASSLVGHDAMNLFPRRGAGNLFIQQDGGVSEGVQYERACER